MNKILTVSIAAYNVQNSLEMAVQSIVSANNSEKVEVLIINDGSTDDTSKIAHKISNRHPTIVKVVDKANGGYGSTVNEAIRIASGKYFKLLDGDDCYETDEFDKFLEQLTISDEDMIITPFELVYRNRHSKDRVTFNVHEGIIKVCDIDENIDMHAITYKTSILKSINIGLPTNCLYTDSLFCLIPMYHIASAKYINYAVYQYCVGDSSQSISKKSRRNHVSDIKRVLYHALDYSRNNEVINGAEKMIVCKLSNIYKFCFDSILLSPIDRRNKELLLNIELDSKAVNPDIITRYQTKKMVLLRKTNYFLYPFAACYAQTIENKI